MEVVGVVGWGQIGLGGLVTIGVMLIFLGWLIPRRLHNRIVEDKDKLIERLQAALDKRDEQFGILIPQSEMIIKLLEDLKRAGQSQSQETSAR